MLSMLDFGNFFVVDVLVVAFLVVVASPFVAVLAGMCFPVCWCSCKSFHSFQPFSLFAKMLGTQRVCYLLGSSSIHFVSFSLYVDISIIVWWIVSFSLVPHCLGFLRDIFAFYVVLQLCCGLAASHSMLFDSGRVFIIFDALWMYQGFSCSSGFWLQYFFYRIHQFFMYSVPYGYGSWLVWFPAYCRFAFFRDISCLINGSVLCKKHCIIRMYVVICIRVLNLLISVSGDCLFSGRIVSDVSC